jgi:hypothetical protein
MQTKENGNMQEPTSTKLKELLESLPSTSSPKPSHNFDYEDIVYYMKNEKDLDRLYKWAKLFTEYHEWLG